ncbi:MAG: HAD family phosphatase [bacterium]
MNRVQAVLFDLDGVLIDSMPSHERAWRQVLSEVGIEPSPLYIRLHEGEKAETTVRKLLQEWGRSATDAEVTKLIARKRELYRSMAVHGLIPAARQTVDKLLAAKIRCGIVTGSVRANMNGVMTAEEIALFDPIISAEMCQHGKPHPEPYLKALEILNLPAHACLVVENAPLGIRSAKAAGIQVVALTVTLPREQLSEADVIVDRHEELLEIVGVK